MVVTVKAPPLNVPAAPWLGIVKVAPTERILVKALILSPVPPLCKEVNVPNVIDTPPAGKAAVAARTGLYPSQPDGVPGVQVCATEKVAALGVVKFDNTIPPVALRTPAGLRVTEQLAQLPRTENEPKLITPLVAVITIFVVLASTWPGCNTQKHTNRAAKGVLLSS